MNMTARTATQSRASSAPKLERSKIDKAIDHDPSAFESVYARFQQAQDDMMKFFAAPGWKRTLVATVTWFGLIAIGGSALSLLLEGLIYVALAGSVHWFLAVAIGILALFIGAKSIATFATRVAGSVLTGEADERAVAAYDAVRAKLTSFRGIFVKEQR
jgi:hypothetical protein